MKRTSQTTCLIILIMVAGSCDQSTEIRHYTEIGRAPKAVVSRSPHAGLPPARNPSMQTDDPEVQAMLDSSVAQVELLWAVPSGWTEQRRSGMRLATFKSVDDDPITCTVIALGGMSGGLEPNVQRWLQQLNLSLNAGELQSFLENQRQFQSQSGLPITWVDFSSLQQGQPSSAKSMSAAIITLEDKTVFIKMTGSLQAVTANESALQIFLNSLTLP